MEERGHALLSASSAGRWLNCPPSARLSEAFPDTSSTAAAEGTLAHSFCELKLRKLFTEPGMPDRLWKEEQSRLKKQELYDPEMERYTDEYVEQIQKIAYNYPVPPYVAVEKQVDYSNIAPEGFGTSDCLILSGSELHVIDFKYGKGVVVSAEENPQMKLYALGALNAYGLIYPVEKVFLHIIQPRIHNFSVWETTAAELRDWGSQIVAPAAQKAWDGEGDFKQGTWCDSCFCPAAGTCRIRMQDNIAALQENMNPITGKLRETALISNVEIGAILPLLELVAPWVKKVQRAALDKLLAAETVPGWKLVEGRSNRELGNPDGAIKALVQAGYKKAMFYEKKPLALTETEKLITKEDYANILQQFILKPKGKPTLAPENDKRPRYQLDKSPQEDFGGENAYKEEGKIC